MSTRPIDNLPVVPAKVGTTAVYLLALVLFATAAFAALTFPKLSGRVVDDANVIDEATRTALTQKLADFETKSSEQLVVVTLPSLQGTSIEDYGYQLGRAWQIGQKGTNNGVLLIVAPSEHKVRIEVGYGLEGTLTDVISRLIIENSITPRFRANDYPGGITRGVDDIIQVLSGDAEEWKQRAAQRPDPKPDWGGVLSLILLLFLFGVIFFSIVTAARRTGPRRPGSASAVPWWLGSGSSGWSSGSGGGFSGGGFSGGGGSFGGGGASGSW